MPRNIVILCDGTWQNEDQPFTTNVVRIFEALRGKRYEESKEIKPGPKSKVEQISLYRRGLGTANFLEKIFGGAFGMGLSREVREAYLDLITHYRKGDRIFLIGFSRGAYTARSLAGLIGAVGIVDIDAYAGRRRSARSRPTQRLQDAIEEAYEYYKLPPTERSRLPRSVHISDSVPAIHAIGVFDTVGALGIPIFDEDSLVNRRFQFHDVTLGTSIRNAFQACAIDEKRKAFKATLWKTDNEAKDQTVKQVWFPGDHGNVGGGGRENDGLSNIALAWMATELAAVGLDLDNAVIAKHKPTIEDPAGDGLNGKWEKLPTYIRDVGFPGYAGQAIHMGHRIKLDDPNYTSIPLSEAGETLPEVTVPKIEPPSSWPS